MASGEETLLRWRDVPNLEPANCKMDLSRVAMRLTQGGPVSHRPQYRLQNRYNGRAYFGRRHLQNAQMGPIDKAYVEGSNIPVAVKTMHQACLVRTVLSNGTIENLSYSRSYGNLKVTLEDPDMELKILRHCGGRHYILGLEDYMQLKDANEGEKDYFAILEYASDGDLLKLVNDRGCLAEEEAKYLFCQILHGVMYLHSRGLCHRDLSLENILLCENYQKVIIPDFGLADDFPLIVNFPWNRGIVGKSLYMPPEVFEGGCYNGRFADMFALGRILYLTLCGGASEPTPIKNLEDLESMREYFWGLEHLSENVKDFIDRLMDWDPASRLSTVEDDGQDFILDHEWLANYEHNIPREHFKRHVAQSAQRQQTEQLLAGPGRLGLCGWVPSKVMLSLLRTMMFYYEEIWRDMYELTSGTVDKTGYIPLPSSIMKNLIPDVKTFLLYQKEKHFRGRRSQAHWGGVNRDLPAPVEAVVELEESLNMNFAVHRAFNIMPSHICQNWHPYTLMVADSTPANSPPQ